MSSSEPAFNNTRWGDIPTLTHANYNKWKDNMILISSARRTYAIVTSDDPELLHIDFDHDDDSDDCKAKAAEAASTSTLSCSPEVRHIVMGMRKPHEMPNTLETRPGLCWILEMQIGHPLPGLCLPTQAGRTA